MCTIEVTAAFGVDIQPDGSALGVRIEGTTTDCEFSPEFEDAQGNPRARVVARVASSTGATYEDATFLTEVGTDVSFSVFIKGVFLCGEEIRVTAACSALDSGCVQADVPLQVVCGLACPEVQFDPPVYGDCDDGIRSVLVTARWSGEPMNTWTVFRYGANQIGVAPANPNSNGITEATAELEFGPEDYDGDTVVISVAPGCEASLELPGLEPCCPGPIELVITDAAGAVQDPDGELAPGVYTVSVSGDLAAEDASTTWSKTTGDEDPVMPPGTEEGESDHVLVQLAGESILIEVELALGDCPPQSASVTLRPGSAPQPTCPKSASLVLCNEDGKEIPLPVEPCLEPGTYRLKVVGDDLEETTKQWTVTESNGSFTQTASSVDLNHHEVTLEGPAEGQDPSELTKRVTVRFDHTDCPDLDELSVDLVPCPAQGEPRPPVITPPPVEEPRAVIPWCIFWLIAMGVLAVAGAILLAIGLCFLFYPEPTTVTKWIGAIATIVGAVLLIIAAVIFVLWLVFCATLRRNCFLVDVLVDLLVLLVSISGIAAAVIAAIGGLLGPLCWIGIAIDAAYFGIALTIAYWFSRVVGCRPWPRWVPTWLRIRLPDWMRLGERN